jgi:hypothetical protein
MGDIATTGTHPCYLWWEPSLRAVGVFSGDGLSSYDAFLLQALVRSATSGGRRCYKEHCYLDDDIFSCNLFR